MLALGRLPNAAETGYCVEHLHAQTEVYSKMNLTAEQAQQQVLASLCLMLLASNEFLYID